MVDTPTKIKTKETTKTKEATKKSEAGKGDYWRKGTDFQRYRESPLWRALNEKKQESSKQ